MKVFLNSHYRGPYRNSFGGLIKLFDLQPGENDLSPDEIRYLLRDAPTIFETEPDADVIKEIPAPPENKMVRKYGRKNYR